MRVYIVNMIVRDGLKTFRSDVSIFKTEEDAVNYFAEQYNLLMDKGWNVSATEENDTYSEFRLYKKPGLTEIALIVEEQTVN